MNRRSNQALPLLPSGVFTTASTEPESGPGVCPRINANHHESRKAHGRGALIRALRQGAVGRRQARSGRGHSMRSCPARGGVPACHARLHPAAPACRRPAMRGCTRSLDQPATAPLRAAQGRARSPSGPREQTVHRSGPLLVRSTRAGPSAFARKLPPPRGRSGGTNRAGRHRNGPRILEPARPRAGVARASASARSMFSVQCSMFDVRPLPAQPPPEQPHPRSSRSLSGV